MKPHTIVYKEMPKTMKPECFVVLKSYLVEMNQVTKLKLRLEQTAELFPDCLKRERT